LNRDGFFRPCEFDQELQVIGGGPQQQVEAPLAADARRFGGRDLGHPVAITRRPRRHQRLPTQYTGADPEQFLDWREGAVVGQFQPLGHVLAVGAEDDQGIPVTAAEKHVDGLGEQPVAEPGQQAVVFALGVAGVARCDHHVIIVLDPGQQFGDFFGQRVAVGAEGQDHVALDQGPDLEVSAAEAGPRLHVNGHALGLGPFHRAVGGTPVAEDDLIDPARIDFRHDDLHAVDFVQRHDQ
tara:strand:+ start:5570 stop:6286 length:717 start_codon:yes stop_codon:yes gene_type:complete